uniref:Uncharacterized protein LOC111132525 n=1 Tax=Crassostrea virginica TaxID=6565 RepID=A0A8B8E8Q1_CRAVI|nr:uncharacterized protein LOC111132525 [Crassostrea virginica]
MKVKVTLMSAVEPEIRRATLENNPDFVNFKKTALELFGEIGTEFLFLWKDDEDDLITMSSEEEFQEALKNVSDGLLRVFIKGTDECPEGLIEGCVDSEIQVNRKDEDATQDNSVRPRDYEYRFVGGKRRCTGRKLLNESRGERGCCHPNHGQFSSEKREMRRMRRASRIMERLQKPKHGCHSWRGRRWESSEDYPREQGHERHWSHNTQGRIRRCPSPLITQNDGCRLRMRKREMNTRRMFQSLYCNRRAGSAPPLRNCNSRYARCKRRVHGLETRVEFRRSASLPALGRSRPCFLEKCTLKRHGYPKRKILLKFENAPTHRHRSEDELSNGKEGCLGRRCKSYRRRAMMRANHDSDMTNTSVLPGEISEPEISELVKTINLEDDTNEEEMRRCPDDGNEGRGRCRHRNQDNNNTDQGEEGCLGKTTGKCQRKYGAQNESLGDNATEYQQTPTVGWEEENENESSLEEKRERRRRRKEYRRAMREEGASAGHSDDNSERCWRSLTIKVGMDGKVKPRRLARKLCKFLNQNEIDLKGYQPDENLKTMWGKGCRRGFDRR